MGLANAVLMMKMPLKVEVRAGLAHKGKYQLYNHVRGLCQEEMETETSLMEIIASIQRSKSGIQDWSLIDRTIGLFKISFPTYHTDLAKGAYRELGLPDRLGLPKRGRKEIFKPKLAGERFQRIILLSNLISDRKCDSH